MRLRKSSGGVWSFVGGIVLLLLFKQTRGASIQLFQEDSYKESPQQFSESESLSTSHNKLRVRRQIVEDVDMTDIKPTGDRSRLSVEDSRLEGPTRDSDTDVMSTDSNAPKEISTSRGLSEKGHRGKTRKVSPLTRGGTGEKLKSLSSLSAAKKDKESRAKLLIASDDQPNRDLNKNKEEESGVHASRIPYQIPLPNSGRGINFDLTTRTKTLEVLLANSRLKAHRRKPVLDSSMGPKQRVKRDDDDDDDDDDKKDEDNHESDQKKGNKETGTLSKSDESDETEEAKFPNNLLNQQAVILQRLTSALEKVVRELTFLRQKFSLRLIKITDAQDFNQMPNVLKDFNVTEKSPMFIIVGGVKMNAPNLPDIPTTTAKPEDELPRPGESTHFPIHTTTTTESHTSILPGGDIEPSTVKPENQLPGEEVPVTQKPTGEGASAEVTSTVLPETEIPVTEKPLVNVSTTENLSTGNPTTEKPIIEITMTGDGNESTETPKSKLLPRDSDLSGIIDTASPLLSVNGEIEMTMTRSKRNANKETNIEVIADFPSDRVVSAQVTQRKTDVIEKSSDETLMTSTRDDASETVNETPREIPEIIAHDSPVEILLADTPKANAGTIGENQRVENIPDDLVAGQVHELLTSASSQTQPIDQFQPSLSDISPDINKNIESGQEISGNQHVTHTKETPEADIESTLLGKGENTVDSQGLSISTAGVGPNQAEIALKADDANVLLKAPSEIVAVSSQGQNSDEERDTELESVKGGKIKGDSLVLALDDKVISSGEQILAETKDNPKHIDIPITTSLSDSVIVPAKVDAQNVGIILDSPHSISDDLAGEIELTGQKHKILAQEEASPSVVLREAEEIVPENENLYLESSIVNGESDSKDSSEIKESLLLGIQDTLEDSNSDSFSLNGGKESDKEKLNDLNSEGIKMSIAGSSGEVSVQSQTSAIDQVESEKSTSNEHVISEGDIASPLNKFSNNDDTVGDIKFNTRPITVNNPLEEQTVVIDQILDGSAKNNEEILLTTKHNKEVVDEGASQLSLSADEKILLNNENVGIASGESISHSDDGDLTLTAEFLPHKGSIKPVAMPIHKDIALDTESDSLKEVGTISDENDESISGLNKFANANTENAGSLEIKNVELNNVDKTEAVAFETADTSKGSMPVSFVQVGETNAPVVKEVDAEGALVGVSSGTEILGSIQDSDTLHIRQTGDTENLEILGGAQAEALQDSGAFVTNDRESVIGVDSFKKNNPSSILTQDGNLVIEEGHPVVELTELDSTILNGNSESLGEPVIIPEVKIVNGESAHQEDALLLKSSDESDVKNTGDITIEMVKPPLNSASSDILNEKSPQLLLAPGIHNPDTKIVGEFENAGDVAEILSIGDQTENQGGDSALGDTNNSHFLGLADNPEDIVKQSLGSAESIPFTSHISHEGIPVVDTSDDVAPILEMVQPAREPTINNADIIAVGELETADGSVKIVGERVEPEVEGALALESKNEPGLKNKDEFTAELVRQPIVTAEIRPSASEIFDEEISEVDTSDDVAPILEIAQLAREPIINNADTVAVGELETVDGSVKIVGEREGQKVEGVSSLELTSNIGGEITAEFVKQPVDSVASDFSNQEIIPDVDTSGIEPALELVEPAHEIIVNKNSPTIAVGGLETEGSSVEEVEDGVGPEVTGVLAVEIKNESDLKDKDDVTAELVRQPIATAAIRPSASEIFHEGISGVDTFDDVAPIMEMVKPAREPIVNNADAIAVGGFENADDSVKLVGEREEQEVEGVSSLELASKTESDMKNIGGEITVAFVEQPVDSVASDFSHQDIISDVDTSGIEPALELVEPVHEIIVNKNSDSGAVGGLKTEGSSMEEVDDEVGPQVTGVLSLESKNESDLKDKDEVTAELVKQPIDTAEISPFASEISHEDIIPDNDVPFSAVSAPVSSLVQPEHVVIGQNSDTNTAGSFENSDDASKLIVVSDEGVSASDTDAKFAVDSLEKLQNSDVAVPLDNADLNKESLLNIDASSSALSSGLESNLDVEISNEKTNSANEENLNNKPQLLNVDALQGSELAIPESAAVSADSSLGEQIENIKLGSNVDSEFTNDKSATPDDAEHAETFDSINSEDITSTLDKKPLDSFDKSPVISDTQQAESDHIDLSGNSDTVVLESADASSAVESSILEQKELAQEEQDSKLLNAEQSEVEINAENLGSEDLSLSAAVAAPPLAPFQGSADENKESELESTGPLVDSAMSEETGADIKTFEGEKTNKKKETENSQVEDTDFESGVEFGESTNTQNHLPSIKNEKFEEAKEKEKINQEEFSVKDAGSISDEKLEANFEKDKPLSNEHSEDTKEAIFLEPVPEGVNSDLKENEESSKVNIPVSAVLVYNGDSIDTSSGQEISIDDTNNSHGKKHLQSTALHGSDSIEGNSDQVTLVKQPSAEVTTKDEEEIIGSAELLSQIENENVASVEKEILTGETKQEEEEELSHQSSATHGLISPVLAPNVGFDSSVTQTAHHTSSLLSKEHAAQLFIDPYGYIDPDPSKIVIKSHPSITDPDLHVIPPRWAPGYLSEILKNSKKRRIASYVPLPLAKSNFNRRKNNYNQ